MTTIVSDYRALLKGLYWYPIPSSDQPVVATPQPVVLTYSFATTASAATGTAAATFQPFSAADAAVARSELQQWAQVSGVTFLETTAREGDISFGFYNLATMGYGGSVGLGNYPSSGAYLTGDGTPEVYDNEQTTAGDIYVDLSYRDAPSRYGEIHVRTREGSDTAAAAGLRRAIRQVDPGLPIFDVRTMTEHIESNLLFRRIPARLFAVIAPILAGLVAIGIYALVAYTASRRRQEILIRLAVGAPPHRVVRDLVADTLRVAAAGAIAGVVAAAIVLAGGADLSRAQAAVFAIVPIAIAVLASVAAIVPAVRALANPSWEALREE